MSEREPSAADRGWRAELRRSDPAAGAALAPAEAAEMRRAMLTAAAAAAGPAAAVAAAVTTAGRHAKRRPVPPRLSGLGMEGPTPFHRSGIGLGARRLLAAAAVVAICVLAAAEWRALLPWSRQGSAPAHAARRRPPEAENGLASNPPAPSTRTGMGTAARPPLLARATAAGTSPNVERSLPREGAERPAATGEAAERPAKTAAPRGAAAAEPLRQVQFSTPGGTRIIWLVRGESRSR